MRTEELMREYQQGSMPMPDSGWQKLVYLAAALVWMWWDSRPVDLVQEYKNKNKNSKTPRLNTEEEPPNKPVNYGGLGLAGVALSIMAIDKVGITNILNLPKQKKGNKNEN